MSIRLLPLEHYKQAYNKACTYQYRNTEDINYCSALSVSEPTLRYFFESWYELNYRSYYYRYGNNLVNDIERNRELQKNIDIIGSWRFDYIKEKPCNVYRQLKLLEEIRYNIEKDFFPKEEIEEREFDTSLGFLDCVINEIKDAIIGNIPEYKNADISFLTEH